MPYEAPKGETNGDCIKPHSPANGEVQPLPVENPFNYFTNI